MGNRPATLKQADLTRYIAATVRAGVPLVQITIAPDGTVTLIAGSATGEAAANPCDRLLDQ
jgi:hypothetical protein